MRKRRHSIDRKASSARTVKAFSLFARLSAIGVVLFNVFVWALVSLPTESQASPSIASLDLPGISASDLCVGGHHEDGKGPEKSVCPQCFPLSNASHGILLPGEIVLPQLAAQSQRLAPQEPGPSPDSRPALPWQARGPPTSV
jgi:hypothetical protein